MADTAKHYSEAAIRLLRANLGFFNSKTHVDLDVHLESLLEKAFVDFRDIMEIVLQPGTLTDDFDQATYAAWLYRNGSAGAGKTEMLKSIIRNRQVSQALKETDT